MSTGELLLKESFVLLEKRKFGCQPWLTALSPHDLRKCGLAQGRGQSDRPPGRMDPGVDRESGPDESRAALASASPRSLGSQGRKAVVVVPQYQLR